MCIEAMGSAYEGGWDSFAKWPGFCGLGLTLSPPLPTPTSFPRMRRAAPRVNHIYIYIYVYIYIYIYTYIYIHTYPYIYIYIRRPGSPRVNREISIHSRLFHFGFAQTSFDSTGSLAFARHCQYQCRVLNGTTGGGAVGNHMLRNIDCKLQRGGGGQKRRC